MVSGPLGNQGRYHGAPFRTVSPGVFPRPRRFQTSTTLATRRQTLGGVPGANSLKTATRRWMVGQIVPGQSKPLASGRSVNSVNGVSN